MTHLVLIQSKIIEKVMKQARENPARFKNKNLNDPLAGTMADTYGDEESEKIALGFLKEGTCNF